MLPGEVALMELFFISVFLEGIGPNPVPAHPAPTPPVSFSRLA